MTDEQASFTRYEEIAAAIQIYIDSARACDAARMRTAFLPGAMIRGSYGGKPADWSLDDFCCVIGKGGPAADLRTRIVGVEISAPRRWLGSKPRTGMARATPTSSCC